MNAGQPMQPPGSPSPTGVIALLLSLVGFIVCPVLAAMLGLALHGSASGLTLVAVVLGLGALAVVVAVVLAIVTLSRGGAGKTSAILAIVFGVLSIPAGIFGGFWALLFAAGGGAHGRPFREGPRALRSRSKAGDAWSERASSPPLAVALDGLCAGVRKELAEAWLADALLEHASIAAFGALALDLIALGAPPELVRRTHEAALDEVEHARDCFALASAYAGRSITAAPFPEVRAARGDESAAARLLRVATESAIDGCVGEGAAAAAAREAEGQATDPVVARVLATIARDEQRHADLGWDLLRWCLEVGGSDVDDAVREALASHFSAPAPSRGRFDLRAHGRIDGAAWARSTTVARDRIARALDP